MSQHLSAAELRLLFTASASRQRACGGMRGDREQLALDMLRQQEQELLRDRGSR
jgi:hypothetical protein